MTLTTYRYQQLGPVSNRTLQALMNEETMFLKGADDPTYDVQCDDELLEDLDNILADYGLTRIDREPNTSPTTVFSLADGTKLKLGNIKEGELLSYTRGAITGALPAGSTHRYQMGGVWYRTAVLGSQTDSQISLAGLAINASTWVALRAGSITGLLGKLSTNAAGSTCVISVFKNGSSLTSTTINDGAQTSSDTFSAGTHTFSAGDEIDVRITTGALWTSTTANLTVFIEVTD